MRTLKLSRDVEGLAKEREEMLEGGLKKFVILLLNNRVERGERKDIGINPRAKALRLICKKRIKVTVQRCMSLLPLDGIQIT